MEVTFAAADRVAVPLVPSRVEVPLSAAMPSPSPVEVVLLGPLSYKNEKEIEPKNYVRQ